LGYTKTWTSRWFAGKEYAPLLHEDLKVRKIVKSKLYHAGIARIEIERSGNQLRINLHTSRPGIIIGRKGAEVDKLKAEIEALTKRQVAINIREIKKPEVDAQLVAENIALQLEKRIAFRRAMKKAVVSALRLGAKGIKVMCAGRLGGAEIARTEWYREGRVPLHTLAPRRHRLRVGRSQDDLRADRRQGLDLPRRSRAGRRGAGCGRAGSEGACLARRRSSTARCKRAG
jgi:small subunit ribosomal protein S3